MIFIRFALKNPYAVVALTLGLCLLGLAVMPLFPIDILPDFRKPVVVSYFFYPGLPTGEMEKSVTSRVERALTLAFQSNTLPPPARRAVRHRSALRRVAAGLHRRRTVCDD